MRSGSLAFTAALFAAGLVFLALSAGLGPGARAVPLIVSAPTAVLLGLQLLRDLYGAKATSHVRAPGQAPDASTPGNAGGCADRTPAEPAPADDEPPAPAAEAAALGWLLVLAVLIPATGLLAGSALFVTLHLRIRGAERWRVALLGGALAAGLVWLVATRMLAAPISGGWLGRIVAG